jgi:hypothetical protein
MSVDPDGRQSKLFTGVPGVPNDWEWGTGGVKKRKENRPQGLLSGSSVVVEHHKIRRS